MKDFFDGVVDGHIGYPLSKPLGTGSIEYWLGYGAGNAEKNASAEKNRKRSGGASGGDSSDTDYDFVENPCACRFAQREALECIFSSDRHYQTGKEYRSFKELFGSFCDRWRVNCHTIGCESGEEYYIGADQRYSEAETSARTRDYGNCLSVIQVQRRFLHTEELMEDWERETILTVFRYSKEKDDYVFCGSLVELQNWYCSFPSYKLEIRKPVSLHSKLVRARHRFRKRFLSAAA